MKKTVPLTVCLLLASVGFALDLGGGHVKGRLSETIIACGGGSVWMLAPNGKVTWAEGNTMTEEEVYELSDAIVRQNPQEISKEIGRNSTTSPRPARARMDSTSPRTIRSSLRRTGRTSSPR